MTTKPKILAFAGSLRKGSFNRKVIHIAAAAAKRAGADVSLIDFRDYPLPVYDGDLEESDGLPKHCLALKALFKSHHGFLISSPEYNSSVPGFLKNVIDWVSRPVDGEPYLVEFTGKIAGIMSASPGALGGLRGLSHLRSIFMNVGTLVLPDQRAISNAADAFNDDGSLKDAKQQEAIERIATKLAETIAKLA